MVLDPEAAVASVFGFDAADGLAKQLLKLLKGAGAGGELPKLEGEPEGFAVGGLEAVGVVDGGGGLTLEGGVGERAVKLEHFSDFEAVEHVADAQGLAAAG